MCGGRAKPTSVGEHTCVASAVPRLVRPRMAAASSSSGPDTPDDDADGLRAKNCGRDPALSKLQVQSGGMGTGRSETTVRFSHKKSASVVPFCRRRADTADVGGARSKIRSDRSMRSGMAGRVPLAVARERTLIAQPYEPTASICRCGQVARLGVVHPYMYMCMCEVLACLIGILVVLRLS